MPVHPETAGPANADATIDTAFPRPPEGRDNAGAAIAVVGGGPAGLMAAERLAQAGWRVDVYDAMPSVGRKFLLAGRGGLNITHAEAIEPFLSRYGARRRFIEPMLAGFSPQALRDWVHGLGVETFVGSSNRIFPAEMKAAPLLRAWLHRLRGAGVRFHMRHRWIGWRDGEPVFSTPDGERRVVCDALLLALGGGSWPRLGSDGAWLPLLRQRGVAVDALKPANCGFDCAWSDHFRQRHAGDALKTVRARVRDGNGEIVFDRIGEMMISASGIEGGLVYAMSALLREQVERQGEATVWLDLAPDKTQARIDAEVGHPRGARSITSHLQSRAGIGGIRAALLREVLGQEAFGQTATLGRAIKALPIRVLAPRPLKEAISSAGGVVFDDLDEGLMLRGLPGVFCAGEMLDWEAPTGGYLLTACLASGHLAAEGIAHWLDKKTSREG